MAGKRGPTIIPNVPLTITHETTDKGLKILIDCKSHITEVSELDVNNGNEGGTPTPVDDEGPSSEAKHRTSTELGAGKFSGTRVANGTGGSAILAQLDNGTGGSGILTQLDDDDEDDEEDPGDPIELGAITLPATDRSKNSLIVVTGIFVFSVFGLIYVYSTFPELESSEKQHFKLPRNMDDAKVLGDILSRYTDKYYLSVLSGIFFIYIFLQTFAIPGSIFLSILSGFLFSFPVAITLICFCSAIGASFCYLLSYFMGRHLVHKYFPGKAREWAAAVNRHKGNLLNYIIFLRVTPFLPNWFINITAPVIDVPLIPFFLGTFIGVAPPSFVAIQAGTTIHQLSSSSDAVSWTSLAILILLGLVSLVPVVFKDFFKSKFD